MAQQLLPLEVFAILVAALGHDVGHLAVNNAFLVKTQHELALRYNDASPLENMHCSLLYEIIRRPGGDNNVFCGLDALQWGEVRKIIVASILATDMVHHYPLISKVQVFNEKSGSEFRSYFAKKSDHIDCMTNPETRLFLMETVLHTSDISGVCKPFTIGAQWAELIIQEFFNQGDRERALNLPISTMMDRETVDGALLQMNFIDFVVAPLVIPLIQIFPRLIDFGGHLIANFSLWGDRRRENIRQKFRNVDEDAPTALEDEISMETDLKQVDTRIKTFQEKMAIVVDIRTISHNMPLSNSSIPGIGSPLSPDLGGKSTDRTGMAGAPSATMTYALAPQILRQMSVNNGNVKLKQNVVRVSPYMSKDSPVPESMTMRAPSLSIAPSSGGFRRRFSANSGSDGQLSGLAPHSDSILLPPNIFPMTKVNGQDANRRSSAANVPHAQQIQTKESLAKTKSLFHSNVTGLHNNKTTLESIPSVSGGGAFKDDTMQLESIQDAKSDDMT